MHSPPRRGFLGTRAEAPPQLIRLRAELTDANTDEEISVAWLVAQKVMQAYAKPHLDAGPCVPSKSSPRQDLLGTEIARFRRSLRNLAWSPSQM